MSKHDVEVVARAIEGALASDDKMPESIARAAMAADPRVPRLQEALRLICNQTDGGWAIKLARAALAEADKHRDG
jgi:hypothetical protein